MKSLILNNEKMWEIIITSTYKVVKIPPYYMQGECGRFFKHQNLDMESFRNKVSIYYGDWDFNVRIVNRKEFSNLNFLQFVANSIRLNPNYYKAHPNETQFKLEDQINFNPKSIELENFAKNFTKRSSPCHYLWDIVNFGTLLWDWVSISRKFYPYKRESDLDEVYGKTEGGETFLPRIFLYLPPEATEKDFIDYTDDTLNNLKELPDLKGGIDRESLKKIIIDDLNQLCGICENYGTFGDASIIGAYNPIDTIFIMRYDGNTKRIFLETSNFFYAFTSNTS